MSTARPRSLRVPPLNLVKGTTTTTSTTPTTPTTTIHSLAGPSNITLFLTNLRLLDLDLRPDWPDISALTFSTKDAQQNQKKRIQCVEWALYQLFALWDPEEARNKLQPFFPPLEPVQSLNLRAALYRCLDQAKKNGILGRDTVLRKTMLDECKGERLDEVLAVFSNAVLKKVLQSGNPQYEALAQQLASENFSYSGERTILSTLILAHKASLSQFLRRKEDARAKYQDFSDLLELNDRRIARRHEQLKQTIEEHKAHGALPRGEVYELQDAVQKNWAGNLDWLDTILYGDGRSNADGFLAAEFDTIWKNVNAGSISEVEGKSRGGLLEQLDARVKDQEKRLARWQDFGKTLSKTTKSSPAKDAAPGSTEPSKIDLGFNRHQALQISRSNLEKVVQTSSSSLDEYSRLVDNMRAELADVSKPQVRTRPPRQSLAAEKRRSLLIPSPSKPTRAEMVEEGDEGWSSASDLDEKFPEIVSPIARIVSQTPTLKSPVSPGVILPLRQMKPSRATVPQFPENAAPRERPKSLLFPESPLRESSPSKSRPTSPPASLTNPLQATKAAESESDLADQILNSVSASSPSPKKPRHTLSLAERTRMSMSRTSLYRSPETDDETEAPDLPRLSTSRPSLAPGTPSVEADPHADLIERTRKSMAGFEAAQKKAQIERRRSMKQDAKAKQRQSSYFPKVEEEVSAPDMRTVELLEGDPDYESVFKSRPKIATSPDLSLAEAWEGEAE